MFFTDLFKKFVQPKNSKDLKHFLSYLRTAQVLILEF